MMTHTHHDMSYNIPAELTREIVRYFGVEGPSTPKYLTISARFGHVLGIL
jgi:hypothetical protein